MDFSQIVLNHHEKKLLKQSSKYPVPENQCFRLLDLGFVDREYSQAPGSMPVSIGLCRINNTGKAYLLYRKDINRTRYFVPIVVSIATTLLLNGIIQLLLRMSDMIQRWI